MARQDEFSHCDFYPSKKDCCHSCNKRKTTLKAKYKINHKAVKCETTNNFLKVKKIAGDRFTSHKSADIELHLWGSKTFSQQIFPTELVMSAWKQRFRNKYFRTKIFSTDWESDERLRILKNESRWVASAHLFSCFGQKLLCLTFPFQPTHFRSKRVHF